MAAINARARELTEFNRGLLRVWLAEFEQGWDEDQLAERVRRLPPPGSPLRWPALVEFVKIDLAKRWQNGRPMHVEDYLLLYPELRTAEGAPPDLVEAETEARHTYGDAASAWPVEETEDYAPRRSLLPLALLLTGALAGLVALGLFLSASDSHGTIRIELAGPTDGIEVRLNGEATAVTNLANPLRLPEGNHNVAIFRDGFVTLSHSFAVRRGDNPPVRVRLQPVAVAAATQLPGETVVAPGPGDPSPAETTEEAKGPNEPTPQSPISSEPAEETQPQPEPPPVPAEREEPSQNEAAAPDEDDDAQPDEAGIEILPRGPLHEAFATATHEKPQDSPVVAKEPPPPIEELPAAQKPAGEDVQWVPGYWAWDDERDDFLWVTGLWRIPPPDRKWVPGSWVKVDDGWQWVAGYWAAGDQRDEVLLPKPPDPPAVALTPEPEEPAEVPATVQPPPPDGVYPQVSVDDLPAVNVNVRQNVFANGWWVWNANRWAWRHGFWYRWRPGWCWVPPCYRWRPGGYVFVAGYWDYVLGCRGVCCPPCRIPQHLRNRRIPFCHRPRHVLPCSSLFSCLFVRPGCWNYCFGDFFDARCRQRGFVCWCDRRLGPCRDPLFAYYRCHHKHNPRWERDLHVCVRGRFNGDLPRPPRTLIEQNKLVLNVSVKGGVANIFLKNQVIVSNFKQLDHRTIKLEAVSRDRRESERRAAQHLQEVSRRRGKQEEQLRTKGGAPTGPRSVKLDVPDRKVNRPVTGKGKAGTGGTQTGKGASPPVARDGKGGSGKIGTRPRDFNSKKGTPNKGGNPPATRDGKGGKMPDGKGGKSSDRKGGGKPSGRDGKGGANKGGGSIPKGGVLPRSGGTFPRQRGSGIGAPSQPRGGSSTPSQPRGGSSSSPGPKGGGSSSGGNRNK